MDDYKLRQGLCPLGCNGLDHPIAGSDELVVWWGYVGEVYIKRPSGTMNSRLTDCSSGEEASRFCHAIARGEHTDLLVQWLLEQET